MRAGYRPGFRDEDDTQVRLHLPVVVCAHTRTHTQTHMHALEPVWRNPEVCLFPIRVRGIAIIIREGGSGAIYYATA